MYFRNMDSVEKNHKIKQEFVMELFLDTESVSIVDRLAAATANVINENHQNLTKFNDLMKTEYYQLSQMMVQDCHSGVPVAHRIKGFYEETIRKFGNNEYIERFKMKRSTVQALIAFLKPYLKPGNVPLDIKVHVFLWFMVNDSSYSDIGRLFGLHKSSVSYIFHEIALLLTEEKERFISWPSVEKQQLISNNVNSRFRFPNCVGFIDACRLKVGSQRNKREKPDIVLLQAVCDDYLTFVDVHVGDIGKTKKSKLFKDSSLSNELKIKVDFQKHILGDSEYKLKKYLITPFTSEEVLTSEEMKFNEIHWKTRSYIAHAFELLKERFRKLNHIDVLKPESVNILIISACVLHNFVLLHEGCSEVKEELITCDDGVTINSNVVKTAEEKRQFLCNYIEYMGIENN